MAQRPVVNVWNVRMQKMAAIRAAQKSTQDADRPDPFVDSPVDNRPPLPDNWPQVGEAISVSASSSGSSITDDASKRKIEKPKWVSIPKQELQAAADAASASTSTSKRHPNSRKSLRHNPTTNNNPSASTSSQPFPQSRTSSTSHSRPESLHSSPNLARNGMKLPSESDNQGSTCPLDGRNPHSVISPLPDNLHPSPNQVDSRRSETTNDPSQPKKHPSALNYLAASRSQSHLAPAVGYSATSSRSTLPPQPTNLPQTFHATAPVFFSQSTQSTHSSANASNSSSPGIQHLHLLSPPASSSTSPQSLLPHPPFPHPHLHGQSTYPHAPYPLYNLSMPPMNSYDYASPDIAFRSPSYLPYPAPSNLTTLPHYNQSSSGPLPNGTSPAQPTDRNRVSPTDTLITKTNDPPVTRERMVFGSIDLSSANSDDVKIIINNVEAEEEKKEEEKKKKLFAIGVEDGHDLPGRSRPAQKKNGGKAAGGRPPSVKEKSEKKDEKDKRKIAEDKDDSTRSVPAVAPKVLTVEPRWTFGTTSTSPRPSSSSGAPSPSVSSQPPATEDDSSAEQEALKTSFSQSASGTSTPFKPQVSGLAHLPASSSIPVSPSIPVHPYHVHLHRVHSPVHASTIPPPPPPPLSIPMQMPPSMPPASTTSDPDLEVKDYGFGFGDASGLGYAPILAKERAREWEAERARERAASDANDAQALVFNQDDVITSPMTENVQRDITADKDNSIHDQREHFHSREHHFGRGKRGFSVGRGGYGDRGGAGSYRRPRGSVNGYPRGFGRGGGHYHPRGGAGGISPVNTRGGPSSPFNVTPPHHFQTLPLDSSGAPSPLAPLGGFYHPHPHHPNPGRPYIPPGYEAFNPSPTIAGVPPPLPVDPSGIVLGQPQSHHPHLPPAHQMTKLLTPPVPVPKTTISFPLDSTRYYLLGQLEYYLSAENMAQDFYLRQQMDARGWIPISLIASFNRVRQLTQDVQLVKDVLYLSSLVQVRGNMVRMGGWEPFVLPDAAPSTVEDQPLPYLYQNLTNYYYPEDAIVSAGAESMNGDLRMGEYPELLHATPMHHHHPSGAGEGVGYPGGGGVMADGSMMNGHAQEVDDDDDDEVEIVMGQGVGTFMYDRRAVSS